MQYKERLARLPQTQGLNEMEKFQQARLSHLEEVLEQQERASVQMKEYLNDLLSLEHGKY